MVNIEYREPAAQDLLGRSEGCIVRLETLDLLLHNDHPNDRKRNENAELNDPKPHRANIVEKAIENRRSGTAETRSGFKTSSAVDIV